MSDTSDETWKDLLRERDKEVHALKEELRALRDTLVDGLVVIDDKMSIRSFNPAAEQIFGYRAAEVIGQNVKLLMPEPYRQHHDGYVINYLHSGDAKIIGIGREVVGLRKDGATFPMDLAIGEMALTDGRYFVGIVRDLTEQKKVDAQLRQTQKMEAIGQLTGGIAHDFNNQLSVVLMDLESLDDIADTDEKQRELIQEAQGAAQSAADLTQQLLAFSRNKVLDPSTIDPTDAVRRMAGLISRSMGDTIELDIVEPTTSWKAKIDSTQLENAILNLAINGRDAMPDGGRLSIEVKNAVIDEELAPPQADFIPGEYVCLCVTDNGSGMQPDVIERAFEPFFTTKPEGRGTGMGLAMTYGFVKQSGGHASIYSESGLGTTVSLYFPRAEEEGEKDRPSRASKAYPGEGRILLVDDHPQLRKRVKRIIGTLGYQVVDAASPAEALDILEQDRKFDVLLTDVAMPGMNGYELANRALEMLPGLNVAFVSGYADSQSDSSELLGQRGERTPHLQKPFSKEELAETLGGLMGRRD